MGKTYSTYIFGRLMAMVPVIATGLQLNAQVSTQTFYYTGHMQTFTVPLNCMPTMTIEALGAGGGSVVNTCPADGGLGASMRGTFCATSGKVLYILVGQAGLTNGSDAGGGGGSFVVDALNNPLVVAGGGGGATNNVDNCGSARNGVDASIFTGGTPGGNGLGSPGSGGGGGTTSIGSGGSGGGFYSNGTGSASGRSFLNGGNGGTLVISHGGYGGGGAGWFTGGNGGGGGGYSGGATSGTQPYSGGGGGGSYNSGLNQQNIAGVQAGNGMVIITYSLGMPIPYSIVPPVICSGESATLNVSGMVSYTWSNGSNSTQIDVAPHSTTQYTVSATNTMGCVSRSVLTVTVNPLPQILAVTTPTALCPGGTATITASGANSFTWSTGAVSQTITANPGLSKSFTVTGISPEGCIDSVAAAVNMNTVTLNVTASTFVCMGKTINLNASGAVSYTWNTGLPFSTMPVSPVVVTGYTVTATDINNCTLTDSVRIDVKELPVVGASAHATTVCKGEPIKLRAWGAISYAWSSGGNDSVIEFYPPVDIVYDFIVTGTDANGCSGSAHVIVNVDACSGMGEIKRVTRGFSAYPNPGNGLFQIELPGDLGHPTARIYSVLGQFITEQPLLQAGAFIDLRNEKEGFYLLYVFENGIPVGFLRLVKE